MQKPFGWAFIGAGTLGAGVAREIIDQCRRQLGLVYPFEKQAE